MMPSRKDFRFHVVPSDRQLWAIGMVVVQWSLVETMMTIFVHGITAEDESAREKFDATHSSGPRLDQWQELTSKRVMEPWRTQILATINETRQVQELRDKIIHGTWADTENAPVANPEAEGPFNRLPPHHPFKWKLTFGDIKKVALRIDALHHSMWQIAIAASGGKPSTIGGVLNRISNIPNHAG